MSADIINIDDHRQHLVVFDSVDNRMHVVPVALVVSIRDGAIDPFKCDKSMMRGLMRHLLEVIAQ